MKHIAPFLIGIFSVGGLFAQQDLRLPGVVVEQNSKYKTGAVIYLPNAEIKSAGAAPQRSDIKGEFALEFSDRPGGDVARIFAAKSGYNVVNEEELKQASVIGRLQPLKIVMCPAGQLYDNQIAYYKIATDASRATFERKIATLQKTGVEKDRLIAELQVQFNQEIKTIAEAISLLKKQLQITQQQAKELADKWVIVNLDDEDPTYQRAFTAFQAENIELAKAILDSVDLEKRLALNSSAKAKEEALRDTLQKNILKRETEMQQDVNMCLFKARLHILDYEFEEAERLYDLAIEYDKGDIEITYEAAAFMRDQYNFSKAEAYFQRALSQSNGQYEKLAILMNLAGLLKVRNDFTGAKKCLEEALLISKKISRKDPDRNVSMSLIINALGELLHKQNDLKGAKGCFIEALNIIKNIKDYNFDENQAILASILYNFGLVLVTQNEFPQAKNAYEEALQIFRGLAEKRPDKYLQEVAIVLNDLGIAVRYKKDASELFKYMEEALQIRRKLAIQNPKKFQVDLSATLSNMGIYFVKQYFLTNENRFLQEGLKSYEEALMIIRELVAQNPNLFTPHLAMILSNLGKALLHNNELSKAKKNLQESVIIYRQLAEEAPDVYQPNLAKVLTNLGENLMLENDLHGAKIYYEETLLINRQLVKKEPEAHLPDLGRTLFNLGVIANSEKDISGEKKYFEEALLIFTKFAVKDSDEFIDVVAIISGNLAWCLLFDKQFASAEQSARNGLQKGSQNTWIYTNLAHALLFQGKWEEAKTIYAKLKNESYLPFGEGTFKDAFIEDLDVLEKAGITHPDVQKARAFLNQKE